MRIKEVQLHGATKSNSLTPKVYCRSRRLTRQEQTSIEESTYSTLWEADRESAPALPTLPVATLCITFSAAKQAEQEHEKSSKRQRNAQHTTSMQATTMNSTVTD